MPYFTLANLAGIHQAINLLSHAHGAYTAVDILKRALADVEEPEGFDAELQQARSEHGRSHEGPADADRAVLKAAKTAANSQGPAQDAVLELLSLAIAKLGVAKGSQVLSLLVFACGFDPTLLVIVLKLCVLLAHSQTGKKIVATTGPKLQQAIGQSGLTSIIAEPLRELVGNLGNQGAELFASITAPQDLVHKTADPLERVEQFFAQNRPFASPGQSEQAGGLVRALQAIVRIADGRDRLTVSQTLFT